MKYEFNPEVDTRNILDKFKGLSDDQIKEALKLACHENFSLLTSNAGQTNTPDGRNVVDYMKYWKDEAILAHMDIRRHNFSVVIENELKDLNVGNIVRSANAFMADRIILLWRRRYDRRAAISTYKYMHFRYAADLSSFKSELINIESEKGIKVHLVAIDNNIEAKPLPSYHWPVNKHVVMIFGHENAGVHPDILSITDDVVYCPQYGSVRSLNVAVAAGIFMSDYCAKTLTG
jgi:tRNA G18 (ribose-2'-O)-methylase SpoU